AMPGLIVCAWLAGDALPSDLTHKSAGAIIYLAVCGSLLGFTLFFYILKKLSPSAVSLITLITPVLALIVGVVVAGEKITTTIILGAAFVLIALLFYVDWSFGHWFEWSLRKPAQTQQTLDEIKHQVIRFK